MAAQPDDVSSDERQVMMREETSPELSASIPTWM